MNSACELQMLPKLNLIKGEGAVGAIDCSPELRRKLARESTRYSHPLMPQIPEPSADRSTSEETRQRYAEQIKQLHLHKVQDKKPSASSQDGEEGQTEAVADAEEEQGGDAANGPADARENTASSQPTQGQGDGIARAPGAGGRRQQDSVDKVLHHISIGLMMAIFAILYRKALQLYT